MASNSPLRPANSNDLPRPPIVDLQGNPYTRPTPTNERSNPLGSGDGGPPTLEHMMDIGGLKKNVGFLNWALGIVFVLGLGAIITSYLLLAGRIDDRYDKIGTKLDGIVNQIGDLRVSVTQAEDGNDHSQTGSGAGKARGISGGKGSDKPNG